MSETSPAEASNQAHGEHEMGHVVPFYVLFAVFIALLVFTYVTVAATWFDLGAFNVWVALGIATVKASLVVLYFMHLRYDNPLNGMLFVISLGFLALFLTLTLLDTFQYQPFITNW